MMLRRIPVATLYIAYMLHNFPEHQRQSTSPRDKHGYRNTYPREGSKKDEHSNLQGRDKKHWSLHNRISIILFGVQVDDNSGSGSTSRRLAHSQLVLVQGTKKFGSISTHAHHTILGHMRCQSVAYGLSPGVLIWDTNCRVSLPSPIPPPYKETCKPVRPTIRTAM